MKKPRFGEAVALQQIFALLKRISISPAYLIAPIALSMGAAAAEGISVALLIPMLQGFLAKDFSFLKEMYGIKDVLAFLPVSITGSDKALFGFLLTALVGSIFLKNILRYSGGLSISYIAIRAHHRLRKILFGRYLGFGKMFFDRTNIGHHTTVLTHFAGAALQPVFIIDKYFNALFAVLAYFLIMTRISWQVTLFALPLLAVLHFGVLSIIRKIKRLSQDIADKGSELNQKSVEIISSIPLVQANNAEAAEREHFTEISDVKARLDFRNEVLQQGISPLQELISLVGAMLLFVGMVYLLVRHNEASAPEFIVYFYVLMNAANKFRAFTGIQSMMAATVGPFNEVMAIFEDDDKYILKNGHKAFEKLTKDIEFKHLSFSYSPDRQVLNKVDLKIEKGSMTAIVGPTGAGKSTIISLLLRFYDCPPNMLFVDGTDIRDFDIHSLRDNMALVSQDTLLLNDTLRANIAYGSPDATETEIKESVRRARLEDFIKQLPDGLDTRIGDRGVKLSGGEKQRVSIARALLKKADILILDEATSSLDSHTERLIQEAIDDAVNDKTAIVIAHRLSTIRHADKIVVIDKGHLAEEGSLEALLAKKGIFHQLWEEQKFY